MDLDDQAVLNVIEPMMDDVMSGVANRDYARHSQHFSVDLKSTLSSEDFLMLCDKRESLWGRPGQRDVVTIFRKEKSFSVVWHQHYGTLKHAVQKQSVEIKKRCATFVTHRQQI